MINLKIYSGEHPISLSSIVYNLLIYQLPSYHQIFFEKINKIKGLLGLLASTFTGR
jgi:hypothetical protein